MTAQLPHGPHRPQHTAPYGPPYTAPYIPAQAPHDYRAPFQPVYGPPHVIRGDRNGLGTAGLVVGIVSLCFAVIPVVGLIAWVIWPVGVALSGVGMSRANRAVATNRSTALAGLIVSLTAAAVCCAWVVFTVFATSTGASYR